MIQRRVCALPCQARFALPCESSPNSSGTRRRLFPFALRKENDMTDTQKPQPDTAKDNDNDGVGTPRPDQGGTVQPGQEPPAPATGGEGAAGAGGPKGFGTGN